MNSNEMKGTEPQTTDSTEETTNVTEKAMGSAEKPVPAKEITDSDDKTTDSTNKGADAFKDMADAAEGATDSVQRLFAAFPDPDSGQELDGKAILYVITVALKRFITDPPSQDPDYEFLLAHAKRSFDPCRCPATYFRQQLAHLAIQKPLQRKDKSAKGRQLKLHRWIAMGRKSEMYPFTRTDCHPPASTVKLAPLMGSPDCSNCGKKHVNMRCPGCNILDETFLVHKATYCNKKCLEAHAKAHKPLCDSRKMIYRATKLLYFIFLSLQEATYMYPIEKISVENGITYFNEYNWDRASITGRPVFHPFPKHVANSPSLRRALMFWGQAEEIGISFFSLVVHIFRPICKNVELANVIPRNVTLPLCHISGGRAISNVLYRHPVLRLTLKSDEAYVVDLTAVILGWKEILAPWFPWDVFRTDRVEIGNLVPTRGLLQSLRATFVQNELENFQLEVRATVLRSIIDELEKVVEVNSNYNSLEQILKAPIEEYTRIECDIADMVKRRIFMMIKSKYHKSAYRLWPDFSISPPYIQLAHKKADVLKKEVWLTPKEFDKLNKSGADMKKIWAERIKGKFEGNEDEEDEEEKGENLGENSAK
ncbi:hypothetical protein O1611_g3037 [Lasiodiplodia mahajangana]|uniref:Uncharacterized protein n=1 Tax=Lasiodiplodia mahajangana TaxID=1108764 RepID=A0ACC2JTC5_9PEZI|nr:hypothetical protein O1611_g3037 [Lasiodiplodia mahajangana]